MTKKLWPDGYNFFVNTRKAGFYNSIAKLFKGSSANAESKSHISAPDSIIINTGYQTTRFPLKSSHEKFESVYALCSDILKQSLSVPQKNWSYAAEDEWFSSLSGKSVYMSYSSSFAPSLFAKFAGSGESEISSLISEIDSVVIASSAKPFLYIKGGNTYLKCSIDSDTSELEDIIEYFQQSFDDSNAESSIINYSFELRFDKMLENQHVVLESMIPIYSNPIDSRIITADNPLLKNDGTINTNVVDRILAIFEINPNPDRRYTESGGTLVFVENDCTLKIHSNGFIEYNVSNGASGLKLVDSASMYNNICAAADFMDSINTAAGADKKMTITSPVFPSTGGSETAEISFDYTVDGLPVKITEKDFSHAVQIKTENGYLKQYKHMLRTYDVTQQSQQVPLYIDELDKLIAEHPDAKHTYINKMYICYKDDGTSGEKKADWNLEKGEE